MYRKERCNDTLNGETSIVAQGDSIVQIPAIHILPFRYDDSRKGSKILFNQRLVMRENAIGNREDHCFIVGDFWNLYMTT